MEAVFVEPLRTEWSENEGLFQRSTITQMIVVARLLYDLYAVPYALSLAILEDRSESLSQTDKYLTAFVLDLEALGKYNQTCCLGICGIVFFFFLSSMSFVSAP